MAVDTFTQGKNLLDDVAKRITDNIRRRQQALTVLQAAQADLTAMVSAYQTASDEIDALALANSGDAQWQALKAEKDLIVADRATEAGYVDNLITAWNGVTSPY